MRLLLIEDDAKIAQMLRRGLQEEGFAVQVASDGVSGLEQVRAEPFDICILDVLLPRLDGFGVLERLRAGGSTLPVLMLTARDDVPSRVRGLNLGADDYLVKPFAFAELLARIRALLRREAGSREDRLRCGELELDPLEHRVWCRGEPVELSTKQFALLELLLRNPGHVVSRAMILERVWGYTFDPGTNLVDVHIAHLRQKIDGAAPPSLIQTVRGVGYRVGVHETK